MAPSSSHSCLGRLRRCNPPLGLVRLVRPARGFRCPWSDSHATWSSSNALASARLQRLVACVPSPRPHPRFSVERPHHSFLVPGETRRRIVCVLGWRRETARNLSRRRGRGRVRPWHWSRAWTWVGRRTGPWSRPHGERSWARRVRERPRRLHPWVWYV